MTPDISEKRKCARLDIALSVFYSVKNLEGEASELAEALSSDISAGGLRLMTPAPLETGSLIDLEIIINGEKGPSVHASGEVVWQSKLSDKSYETGVVIRHMDEADQKRLMGFVFDQMSRLVGMKKENKSC